MSDLDNAMLEHIGFLVLSEKRPFCFKDFLYFQIDERPHGMKHGTFRNKVSKLMKENKVEWCYTSGCAFYTLKGYNFGKPVTPSRTGIKPHNSLLDFILSLPYGQNSLHNIRLRFMIEGLWSLFYDSSYHYNPQSKDIRIASWRIDDLFIGIVVHKTDTVSVEIGCSYTPIVSDIGGIIKLSNGLTRVEERLSTLINSTKKPQSISKRLKISDHNNWLVTMWHFGKDSVTECGGKDFHVTWKIGEHTLIRAYTKLMKVGKKVVRLEEQEYPNKALMQALMEKINLGN
jgi:hypothetical protein